LIEKGKLAHIFVGLYRDAQSEENRRTVARANAMKLARGSRRELRIDFYDSESAQVWGR